MTHTREEAVTRVVIEHGDGFQEEIDVARLAARADVDPLPVARARSARTVIHLLERIARPMQDETYEWKEIADGAEHLALHAYELHHEALSATSLAARAEHLILCDTRQRLARPERWTRRGYARDSQGEVCSLSSEQATCWCVTGALTLASIRTRPLIDGLDRDTSEAALHNAEDRVARAIGGGSVPNWQDAETTTHEQVLKALDDAIASQCRCGNMHTDPTCVVHPPPPVRERENERQAVAVLARELEPPQVGDDGGRPQGLYQTIIDRLLKRGIEARVLLYFGMTLKHLGVIDHGYNPQEIAQALVTRSPNAFPAGLRLYVTDFRRELLALVARRDA